MIIKKHRQIIRKNRRHRKEPINRIHAIKQLEPDIIKHRPLTRISAEQRRSQCRVCSEIRIHAINIAVLSRRTATVKPESLQ